MSRVLDLLAKSLLAILPFSVFIAVFFTHRIGIPGTNYLKELLLVAFAGLVAFSYWKYRVRPKF